MWQYSLTKTHDVNWSHLNKINVREISMYLARVIIVLHEENRNSILTVKCVSSKFASCSLLSNAVL